MMKRSIALRLMAFFAAALLLYALVSAVVFRGLFTKAVLNNKKAEMLARANALAGTLRSQMNSTAQGGGRGMGGPGGGYGAAVRLVTQSFDNVWVLDEHLEVLSAGRMMGSRLSYDSLPPDAERLVREVFEGGQPFSSGFSELLGYPTLTLGVPITQGSRVAGALLIHDAVAGMDEAAAQGQKLLLYAGAGAMALSALLAMALSLNFTRPIRRMKTVAGQLAQGDYSARTGISRKDEFGQLAQSIDCLSLRLQEAQTASEQAEQQRRDFLAKISHELRTPVTVLRGSLEALRDGVVNEPGMMRSYHEQMLKETEGLQRLVNDLMELTRLQNTDFPIERTSIALDEVFRDALRSAGQLAQAKNIAITERLPAQAVPFMGDYARLRQMLLIVLDNAVKFSPENSTIYAIMDTGSLAITDEGPGIAPEDLPGLFERFHQSLSSAGKGGSGLGLAIAKQIALRHDIGIALDSEQGKGTTVRFTWG
jgi:signal transduction histidine kinase